MFKVKGFQCAGGSEKEGRRCGLAGTETSGSRSWLGPPRRSAHTPRRSSSRPFAHPAERSPSLRIGQVEPLGSRTKVRRPHSLHQRVLRPVRLVGCAEGIVLVAHQRVWFPGRAWSPPAYRLVAILEPHRAHRGWLRRPRPRSEEHTAEI